jgi:hypothetical protein
MFELNRSNFVASKKVGFVLKPETKNPASSTLSWNQANDVLKELRTSHHVTLTNLHKVVLGNSESFQNVAEKSASDERKASDAQLGSRGHIYASLPLTADYIENDIKVLAVEIFFAFTVCVRLPVADGNDATKDVQSKFWYNAIISGESNIIDTDLLSRCSVAIDELAKKSLTKTLPVYSTAVNSSNNKIGKIVRSDAFEFNDLCIEISDEKFRRELEQIGASQLSLPEATGTALTQFHKLANSKNKNFSLFPMSDDISRNVLVQSDTHHSKALYIVTTSPRTGGFAQKALGVTSSFGRANGKFPSSSIAAARVSSVAVAI